MLQKNRIPGRADLLTVAPVHNKLRHFGTGIFRIDFRKLQNLEAGRARLPVSRDYPRSVVLAEGRVVLIPLATDMLDKLGVPCTDTNSTLAPIEDKFRNRVLNKVLRNTGIHKYLQGILTGLPFAMH